MAAEGLGDAGPALAELAGGQNQHAVSRRGEIGDGSLHRSRAGAGENDDIVLGADEVLKLRENARVEGAEFRGPVVDVCGGHGKLGSRKERRRSRSKQASFADHAFIVVAPGWRPRSL